MTNIILLFVHCLTSNTDPILWPTQTTPLQGGKLVNLQEENPCSYWGRKNPMSHLSRMKNPDLPYLSIAAALWAYVLRPASLDVLVSLGTTASFSGLLRPGFTTSQLCLANCLPYLVAFVSYILTIP